MRVIHYSRLPGLAQVDAVSAKIPGWAVGSPTTEPGCGETRCWRPWEPLLPLYPPWPLILPPWVSLTAEWDGVGPIYWKRGWHELPTMKWPCTSTLWLQGTLGQPTAHLCNQDNHQPQFAWDSPRSSQVAGMGVNIAFFHFGQWMLWAPYLWPNNMAQNDGGRQEIIAAIFFTLYTLNLAIKMSQKSDTQLQKPFTQTHTCARIHTHRTSPLDFS